MKILQIPVKPRPRLNLVDPGTAPAPVLKKNWNPARPRCLKKNSDLALVPATVIWKNSNPAPAPVLFSTPVGPTTVLYSESIFEISL